MACYALSSLMETMKLEFLQPSFRVSLDDDEALISLFEKLSSMQDFLWEKYECGGVVNRDLEIKIRDFSLKIEDDIEMQLHIILQLAKDTESQDKARGKLQQTLREAAKDAEELLKIINNTGSEAEGTSDTHPSIHWLKSTSGGSPRCTPKLEETMVGEQHRRIFSDAKYPLHRSNKKRPVIPISGMAGIGKTTLARRMYEDPLVAANFDIKAWATVSYEYNLQQILCELLQSMMPTVKINKGNTLFQLKEELYNHLKDKRYFIVLDDVWNTEDFNDIQQCFPNDPCGSCIMLTTMFQEVARESHSYYWYGMKLLDEDESWNLFCNRLSLKEHMTPKFEKIAKHVVKQCEGLPKSIVAVAKRLSKCNYTLKEWRKLKKEIDSLGALYRDVQYSSKLTLIYNQLPQNLKACFLYFSLFPKGNAIQVRKLLRLWIAEGFLEPYEHRPLEDIAIAYFRMLASRSLVLIKKDGFDYEVKTCWMHGALHSYCVREAQKEGLFCAVNTRQCLGWSLNMLENSFRWLSVRSHTLDYYVFFSTNNPRSVFFFHGDPQMFVPFKLLRTLDFCPSPILKSGPLHLGDLVFLRYLSLQQWFDGLNDVLKSNQNLQTLIISSLKSKEGSSFAHRVSSRIWELPQLCHLELGNMYTVDPPSTDKEHLETLSWMIPTSFNKGMHCKFPNLRKLKIFYKDVSEFTSTRGSCRNPIIILENIEYLSRLEILKVILPVFSITVVEQLVFPTQLKKLSLRGTNLAMSVLRVISQLPYLESLKLENAFYGKVWEVAGRGFPRLNYLFLEARNLERWVADGNHLPNLNRLVLRRCYCLEEIPCGFVKIRGLGSIKMDQCPPIVITSAKWIYMEQEAKMGYGGFSIFVDGERIN